jgi:hypothetical protein
MGVLVLPRAWGDLQPVASGQAGGMMAADWPLSPQDYADAIAEAELGSGTTNGADQRASFSLDEFIDSAPAEPTGLYRAIPRPGLTVFAGEPRTLKTMCSFQLGLSSAAGLSFLDRVPDQAGSFLYVSEEGSRPALADRARRQRDYLPAPSERVRILHRAGVVFTDVRSWQLVRDEVAQLADAGAVVLDTFAALMEGDENSVKDVRDNLRPVQRLIADYEVAVVLVHHVNKYGDGRSGRRLRGSSALWGACDSIWHFERDQGANLPLDSGRIVIEPKDGDIEVLPFAWNRDTFLLEAQQRPACTPDAIADVAAMLIAKGEIASADALRQPFLPVGKSWFAERLKAAVDLDLLVPEGRGRATRYRAGDRTIRLDDSRRQGPDA